MRPSEIHPTAVVDARATVGPGARVGAFSVIGPDVVLGDESEIGHHAVLEGRVVVGPRSRIGHGAMVGGEPQDLKFKRGTPSGVRIGADTVIRECVIIHRATHPEGWTEIGDGCLVMATAHIAHDCRIGNGAIIINYAALAGHCEIGERATIGGLTGLAPFTRIGALAYVGGGSGVHSDVPPYMLATGAPAGVYGVNVVGMRRAGMGAGERRLIRDAHRLLYRSGLTPRSAVERIRAELPASGPVDRLVDFIVTTKRGICRALGRAPHDQEEPVATGEGELSS